MVEKLPIANMKENLDEMQGSAVISKLDLFSGYWMICLEKNFQ